MPTHGLAATTILEKIKGVHDSVSRLGDVIQRGLLTEEQRMLH